MGHISSDRGPAPNANLPDTLEKAVMFAAMLAERGFADDVEALEVLVARGRELGLSSVLLEAISDETAPAVVRQRALSHLLRDWRMVV